jgi:ABC-2 type transport system permease protein
MNDMNTLWKQRLQQYVADTRKYLKYMLNDHLKIVLIFILGGAAYYYQLWLKGLPPSFPAAVLMAIIMGLTLTAGGVRTFLKPADIVFLLPLETRMRPYFIKSFFFSFAFQVYLLLIVTAALAPLYVKATGHTYGSILSIFFVLLTIKFVNFWMIWHMTYFEESSANWTDFLVRFALNGAFAYLLFSGAHLAFLLAVAVIILSLASYYYVITKKKPLKWEHLIDLETKRMMFFYRLANLFTDVPNIKDKVKRRAYADWMLARIPFSQSASYHFLYARTFLRAGDYAGLVVRLTVIGGIVLLAAPLQYGNIVILIITLYLTGFQLIPLWKHHAYTLWVSLYPVKEKDREQAFLALLQVILSVQTILLSLFVMFTDMAVGIAACIGGLVFSQLFVKAYVRSRIKKV